MVGGVRRLCEWPRRREPSPALHLGPQRWSLTDPSIELHVHPGRGHPPSLLTPPPWFSTHGRPDVALSKSAMSLRDSHSVPPGCILPLAVVRTVCPLSPTIGTAFGEDSTVGERASVAC